MMYNKIECPVCGNEVVAKSTEEPQKCRWCRRLFKVKVTRRNKQGKKGKFNWVAEPVDFDEPIKKERPRGLSKYWDEDIYGR